MNDALNNHSGPDIALDAGRDADANRAAVPPTPLEATDALRQLTDNIQEQVRRLHEARAREHVGAAGWRQTALLEEIIQAGRDQLVSANALRQIVQLSTESLRALPLSAGQESRDDQQRQLEGVVETGNQQIWAAHELEGVIEQALQEVLGTPVPEVNAQRLERVLKRVRDQISALDLMIEAARTQVGTLEQMQALDAVSADYQRRLSDLHALGAEEELNLLGTVAAQAVERIAQLDVPGHRQLEKLGTIGEATVKQVSETEASTHEQLQTLESIQAEAEREAGRLRGDERPG